MKKTIQLLSYIFFIFLMGCSEFLDVETPKNQIDTQKVFNDERTANAAMATVYSSMRNSGFLSGNREGIGSLLGAYTDELEVVTNQALGVKYFYDLNIQANNMSLKNLWDITYKQIYIVNQMIVGIEQSQLLEENIKLQLLGESLGLRGILHFYLAQTFGSVPYITSIDYELNKSVEKLNEQEVIHKAIRDLEDAALYLNSDFLSNKKLRLNKTVVQAFLARFYLYDKNWIKASEFSQMVLDDTRFELESIESVFLKDSKSAIWQLKPEMEGRNTLEGESYIFTAVPPSTMKLQMDLVSAFESEDIRKQEWIKGFDANNYHAFKYKQRSMTTGGSLEYSIIIRLEEMYLIKAESAAQLEDFDTFNAILNKIRMRASLNALALTDKTQAIDAVLKERRIELFCEFGHRFYDLKRHNKLTELIDIKPNWLGFYNKLPLPLNELTLNNNLLPQNDGY